MTLAIIFILALTVEALIEYTKLIATQEINYKQIGAILLAVGLSLAAGTDLYALLGVVFKVPFLGTVLTGIMFSRGANYLSDFIKLTQTSAGAAKAVSELDITEG